MSRKWVALCSTMVTVALALTGLAMAQDEESPLAKIMEKVNKTNNSIKKAVRTQVAFKKAGNGKDIAKQAEDLIKLAKQAREIKDAAKKAKDVPNAVATWDELMDNLIKSTDDLVAHAAKGDFVKSKAASKSMASKCTACHEKFRIEDVE